MKVTEIFRSIQGEGRYTGWSSFFIRLHGCNLRCEGCDTAYSYNDGDYEEMKPRDVIEEVKAYPFNCLVITGGEPLLQQEEVLELVKIARKELMVKILLETNGTIMNDTVRKIGRYIDLAEVTLKKHLGREKLLRITEFWMSCKCDADFKFVIGDKSWCWSASDVLCFTADAEIPKDRVWLMPYGSTKGEIEKRSKFVCVQAYLSGWNYSDRLHIRMWNDERGR